MTPHDSFPSKALKDWFKGSARDLPWRQTEDPYAIWVSEVMLQQTQVKTVLAYYKRWLEHFPTLQDLADAETEHVLKLWEGLGYYSRARNLQKGAQQILQQFKGQFPSERKDLLQIKGIGPYTVGALQSFAFKMKSVLIDGNVKRVIARFYALDQDFSISKNHRSLETLLSQILPDEEPWVFNEALMELGALICTPKKVSCSSCPLNNKCLAYQKNEVELYPKVPKRRETLFLNRLVLVFHHDGKWAIQKKEKGIMQDLYEFFFLSLDKKQNSAQKHMKLIESFLKDSEFDVASLNTVTHGFTHHHVTLYPYLIYLKQPLKWHEEVLWLTQDEMKKKPFSSGHKKVLQMVLGEASVG